MKVNSNGYLGRSIAGKSSKYRYWWLVLNQDHSASGVVRLSCCPNVNLPKEMIGKKVRFKMEVMKDVQEDDNELGPEVQRARRAAKAIKLLPEVLQPGA